MTDATNQRLLQALHEISKIPDPASGDRGPTRLARHIALCALAETGAGAAESPLDLARRKLDEIRKGSAPTGRWLNADHSSECGEDEPGATFVEYDAEDQSIWVETCARLAAEGLGLIAEATTTDAPAPAPAPAQEGK